MAQINEIGTVGLDLPHWELMRRNDPRPIEGKIIVGFYSLSHQHTHNEKLVMARFFLKEEELYRAWGWKDDPHCAYHYIVEANEVRKGCPQIALTKTNNADWVLKVGANGQERPVKVHT